MNIKSAIYPTLLFLLATTVATAEQPVGRPYVYKHVGDRDLHLWILPGEVGDSGAARPAVVFFHGGGWVAGPVSQFNRQASYFSARGLTTVQVEYRLVRMKSDDVIVAPIEDAKSAVRWLRKHAQALQIDPDRIAAAGGSAGGHLAAFLGTKHGVDDPGDDLSIPARVQAMVLFNPAVDLGPDSSLHNRGGRDYRRYSPMDDPQPLCRDALIMTGEADVTVPVETLRKFNRELVAVGINSRIIVYPGKKHGFFNLEDSLGPTLVEMDRFFVELGWLQGLPDQQLIEALPKTPPKWN